MNNFFVRYVDFPCRVHGLTIPNPDGTYNIYINSRLSLEMQADTLRHELTHIERDDIYRIDEPLSNVESM